VAETFAPVNSVAVLVEASRGATPSATTPVVLADAGVENVKTGELVFPGMEPGSELGWTGLIGGPEPLGLALTGFKYMIHEDATWDWRTFDLATWR
jgi:hypothetical protein